MSRKIRLASLFSVLGILVVLLVLAGCSSARSEFLRAQRLELSGHPDEALNIYEHLMPGLRADPQRRSEVLFRMGECLVRLDRIPEAFSAFQKSEETDRGNFAAKLRVGEFLLSAGAPERAREQAEAVLAQHETSEAKALWGAALAASGEVDKAKQVYRQVLQADPVRVSVAIALADLYNRDNQVREAKQILQETAARAPKNASPLLALARLHEQEGEVSDAEKAYRQAASLEDTPETNLRLAQFLQRTSRIREAEAVLRRVDAQRPGEPTALPDFELLAGHSTSALDSYEAALSSKLNQNRGKGKHHPDLELIQQRARLATRVIEADLEVAAGKSGPERNTAIERARAHLDQNRLDLDPATIAILEAEIALAAADLPRAAADADRALALAPQSAPAHYVAGLVKAAGGDAAAARSQWQAALQSDDHFAPARLNLAEQALRGGDSRAAEEYVVGVVRDEPGNLRALDVFAQVLAAEKRYAAAQMIARRAQAVDMSSPDPHVVLGRMALEQHRVAEALLEFEHALLLNSHSREAIEGLTDVYRTEKISRAMLARIEQVASADPPSATLMEIAGRLYAEHGWYADARRCLERSLSMDPQRTTAAAALARTFAAAGDLGAAADSASRSGSDSAALLAGVRAQERNDLQTAIASYEAAVRQGDRSGVAANNLAWLYAQLGTNLERALELAESAREMAPESAAVLDTVGVVRLHLRRYSEAIKALESARQLAGTKAADAALLAQINQHLAEAYLHVGKTDAAAALASSDTDLPR